MNTIRKGRSCIAVRINFASRCSIDFGSVEEKYGKAKASGSAEEDGDESVASNASTSDEDDEDGLLATGILDDQYNATLQAIKTKDPRVYDKSATFYTEVDGGEGKEGKTLESSKPVSLSDYHRENLLRGEVVNKPEVQFRSYTQQQGDMKEKLVKELHAAADGAEYDESSNDKSVREDSFLTVKKIEKPFEKETGMSAADIDHAGEDPDGFLDRFLATRAWLPTASVQPLAFESDDDEHELRADQFEEAYNLRFENSTGANEKIMTHARDAAAKYSVRSEIQSRRRRTRGKERSQKDDQESNRKSEKAMLRKLRLEEAEQKLQKIQEAAGIPVSQIKLQDWSKFLTEDWDDERWGSEMRQTFGEEYYAEKDILIEAKGTTRKSPKPKWDTDISIEDIVPNFDVRENNTFTPSADEEYTDNGGSNNTQQGSARFEQKREARSQRRNLERLVDAELDLEMAVTAKGGKEGAAFRYRETSPVAFGLTAQDILMASDSQLNQFAGLKKMATFRDAAKQQRDKKRLGKKARLRQWRRETFGSEDGPQMTLQSLLEEARRLHPVDGQLMAGKLSLKKGDSAMRSKQKRSTKHQTRVA